MGTRRYRVSSSRKIEARPALVYAVIADYRRHHPRIVPPESFRRLEVIEGGVGAGTRTRVEMVVLGIARVFEQVVTEPEPGRVLVESEVEGPSTTSFTVDKADGEESALVTIATDLVSRPGLPGLLERLAISLILPRIYRKEWRCWRSMSPGNAAGSARRPIGDRQPRLSTARP